MNNKIIVYILVLFLGIVPVELFSQKRSKAADLCEKAEKALNQRDFVKALNYLKQATQKDPGYVDTYILMGDAYNFTLKSDSAAACYDRAITLIGEPDPLLYNIAAAEHMKCGQYQKAHDYYELFLLKGLQYTDVLTEAQKGLANSKFAIEAMKSPVAYELKNMGPNINSEWDESLAALTADDETIIFTVRRPKDEHTVCAFCVNEEDLYSAELRGGEWTPRKVLASPVTTGYNEGAQSISPDGNYLLYTMCNADYGLGSCDLYWAKRIGDRWSRPRNFGTPVNTGAWESQPSMAADGVTIYFASSRPGGFGGMDIWKTTMTSEGAFTAPENLGATINTPEDDAAPFIHSDGHTLYFASNGRVGMGGYDLYYSTLLPDGSWSEPKNLGYPINTWNDEINIFINAQGTTAYISSDKDGGFGGLDLYSFDLDDNLRPSPVTYIKGRISDGETGTPLQADIQMIDLETRQLLVGTTSDAETGEYLACVHTGKNVLLNVSRPGYPFYSENFQVEKSYTQLKPYIKDIVLQPAEVGTVVILNNIFFDFDRSDLKPESFVELDRLVDYLSHNKVRIEIGGHTDNTGSAEYNEKLSQERAKSVYNYLIAHGIAESRLAYRGYGMQKPIATNDTEEGRAKNRRTEFTIIQ
ncbi:MAG: OmpA family protein [Bacteroidales bacterium]|nr:OmpA family protein [Bacteroidales bacterium]